MPKVYQAGLPTWKADRLGSSELTPKYKLFLGEKTQGKKNQQHQQQIWTVK